MKSFTKKPIPNAKHLGYNPSHDNKGKFASSDYKITMRRNKLRNILIFEVAILATLSIILADLTANKVANALYPIPNAKHLGSQMQKHLGSKQDIIDEITEQALLFGIDPKKAIALAECESQFDPTAKNPNSTARGVYQYLIGTWEETQSAKNGLERNDYKANIREAMIDLANGEAWRWPDCRIKAGL